jgi:NAD(P)-dependent dehydrogenase (short-subunit alcohol dehydrogenase family)
MKITSSKKEESGGSIIMTASVAGLRSGAGSLDYSASKAAVISMAATSAWQLSKTNIRVNAVCPGLIETGMTAPVFEMARDRGTGGKIGQLNPIGRYGVAEEVSFVEKSSGDLNTHCLIHRSPTPSFSSPQMKPPMSMESHFQSTEVFLPAIQ